MKLLNDLKRTFLLGLVAILPIYVTVRVVLVIFHYVDQALAPQLQAIIGVHVPGLGVVTTLMAITLAGFLMRFVVIRRAGRSLDEFMESIPLIRTVYGAVKQVLLPLLGDSRHRAFKEVVAFEWPGPDLWVTGFLVKERPVGDAPGPDDEVLVFLPTNHLHLGFVVATRRSRLQPVDMTVEEALRTQFSLGVAAPDVTLMGVSRLPEAASVAAAGRDG